ncbi:MAG: AAA family ATPase [Deltaproteobacteria bacterium]|nr:AAA family ATPase [Deltaproteobacteria bacterium]
MSRTSDPPRIYFVGSHATGKTTMTRWVSQAYGLPMITEVARAVLAELETTLEALRTDIELVNRYQTRVFERQIEVERLQVGGFVSDRAFDNLAYTAEHATVLADLMSSDRLRSYMDWVGGGIVFFLRPDPCMLRHDGVRASVEWDSVVRIDGMIKLMLEQHRVRYLPIDTPNMQERVRAVEFVLGRAEEISQSDVDRSRQLVLASVRPS